MDIFDLLTMLGGLSLFLFGMNIMGQALERRSGDKLHSLLETLTNSRAAGLLTGLGVTAVIQSSSATTVMVVGFVNSGLMNLKQAINVIMGANIGTTVTAWILSLGGIESSNVFIKLLKPTSFTPVLAVIGIAFYMFCKSNKKKDTGMILLGFATLMFGMDTMSGAVAGLANIPAFQQLFILFQNPILGVLAGTILTAIVQSSSASVGILQALAVTGQVSFGAAIPIIMGQNIGTCITAMLSSVGANKNAKRAALVHLSFNVIGTLAWLAVFCLVRLVLDPALLDGPASSFNIAIAHTVFNVLCTLLLLPMAGILEKLVIRLVPDSEEPEPIAQLDERLLQTPSIALDCCRSVTIDMAKSSVFSLKSALANLQAYDPQLSISVRELEERSDYYEDILGTYLVKLSSHLGNDSDNVEAAKLLKFIGDYERIADHAVNLVESAEELHEKHFILSDVAKADLAVISSAIEQILDMSLEAFIENDLAKAMQVGPLEQVIDDLKEELRTRHILRLQQGDCTIGAGFVWSDVLTNLERTSDHCFNIAGCVINMSSNSMNLHKSHSKGGPGSDFFAEEYQVFAERYSLT